MVTAPVQKSVIAASGVPFSGHTEYLAERCGTPKPVMMLVAGDLRVALATTHLPLRRVPDAITQPLVLQILRIMHADLKNAFGIKNPRIAVCGLNPHAGEAGLLGDEELRHLRPAIDAARAEGIDAFGPLPADTAFVPREMAKADAFLAMFHDQGLPVLKHAGFGHAVNVTLGLPVIRTSVDHGTALPLAGTGRADVGSLRAAVELAIDLVHRRRASR
jgi:4-hydroxythreonine-4-phosphate dehydrogenase